MLTTFNGVYNNLATVTSTVDVAAADNAFLAGPVTFTGTVTVAGTLTVVQMGTLYVDKLDPQSGTTLSLGSSGDTLQATAGTTNNLGISAAHNWRLTTAYEVGTTSKAYITANLEAVDTTGQGTLGSAMTESSGVFTFPSTGIWYVCMLLYTYDGTDYAYCYSEIDVTTNNSTYTEVAQAVGNGITATSLRETSSYVSTLIDVTDTANVKVKFGLSAATTGVNVWGDSARNGTSMVFIRLGDT